MRHFSVWPLLDAALCGAPGFRTTELDLVTCDVCRSTLVRRELLGGVA